MNPQSKIYIAGHRGMVGSALLRLLQNKGFTNLTYKTHAELDLCNQSQVEHYFESEKPEYVFLAAAKVGGILANNTYRASFLYDNLMLQNNVIHAAYKHGVKKLLFLGSSCIYPKLAPQPLTESSLLSGFLEPTNEPYAIAKIAGIKMCEAYRQQYGCQFISAMPTNLYGPGDNYHPENSHLFAALLRKFYFAKKNNEPTVTIWGTGKPLREFLHVEDLADACLFLMENYNEAGFINVGSGLEISITDLALKMKESFDYHGELVYDATKPDGTPRKIMDSSKIHNLGWKHTIDIDQGIAKMLPHLPSIFEQ